MEIVGGLDIHRGQITFDVLDVVSGTERKGRIASPDRQRVVRWLEQFAGRDDVHLAMEGCTGWRYVTEEVQAAGFVAHVAEPADTQALRGKKQRAKTDRSDARLLRDALAGGRLPESWIPPEHVLEWRDRIRLYKTLVDERTGWQQRIHAALFHHGVALPEGSLRSQPVREWLLSSDSALSVAGRQRVQVGYRMMDAATVEVTELGAQIRAHARRHPATAALMAAHFGIGELTSMAVWAELGDCRRFSRSDQAVRHTGLDISVYSSAGKRSAGHLARQGPAVLRWALYEAGKCAARPASPDYDYYQHVKARIDGTRATFAVARKLARRCYHTLRELGDEAWTSID